jgi:methionyl-tRNA formyltransferase
MSTSLVFAGSPAIAVPYLESLVAAGNEVRTVITREPSPVGRKRVVTPTPVDVAARGLGLSVITADSLAHVDIPDVEIGVVVAYGGLVPARLLEKPSHGWINVHFSVLPSYRGAAPVQRALWDGHANTGVSIFRLVEEMDAGPVYESQSIPFLPDETATEALDRLSRETADLLVQTLNDIVAGKLTPVQQIGNPTFAPKFSKDEARVSWAEPAVTIAHRIRALSDEPGAHTVLGNDRIGIVRTRVAPGRGLEPGVVDVSNDGVFVGTGSGSIELLVVKPAGKASMAASDWARGLRVAVTFE